jgi:hypothetical protein
VNTLTTTPRPLPHRDRPVWAAVVIRLAVADDRAALRRLAELDSAAPLHGATLLAEQHGRPVAALSLKDGSAIGDPFVATADLLALLRLRAAQLEPVLRG